MSTSTTVVATMAVHDNVICWGPTHQLYASIALSLLIFLVPTATVIGTQFMESKSDEETVYFFFKSKASSVRWTQSFQLWQIGIDMAIDREDNSVTRSIEHYNAIFDSVGLERVHGSFTIGWPKDLYPLLFQK